MTPPLATFDHLIHWVSDLDTAMASYDAAGLTTHPALTMPGFRNSAWRIDDERYIELAAVDDWDAVQTSKYAHSLEILRPDIEALGGSGPLTFGVNVPDIRATIDRLRAAGHELNIDEVWFDDRNGGFAEVHVADAQAFTPFFIAYNPPREVIAQMRAEHRAANGEALAPGRPDLAALLVGSTAPEEDARFLGDLLGIPVNGAVVDLPGAAVRFTSGHQGLYGIEVTGLDASDPFDIHGLTVVPVSRDD